MPRSNSGLSACHFLGGHVHRHRRGRQRGGLGYRHLVIFDRRQIGHVLEPELFRVFGDDGGRDHLGHVILGLGGQAHVGGEFPEVLVVALVQLPLHPALAAVVGGRRQIPGAELLIEVQQVLGCRPGGLFRVPALIHVAVDGQPVAQAGAFDELPHAAGRRPGNRPCC